jgi:hypothetical protein
MVWKLLSSYCVPDRNELIRVQFVMSGIFIVLCTVFVLQCNSCPLQQDLNCSIFMKSTVDYNIHVFQVQHPL